MADAPYDVAIIGAGTVGCAVARAYALDGLAPVVLEQAPDILEGASKGNSAILHTGFDAPPGSVEADCVRDGHSTYLQIRERLNLPLVETGALVVAWSEAELAKLDGILDKAHQNGVTDVQRLPADAVKQREPQLATTAAGAVHVPREHVIDPWSAPLAYARQAIANGAEVKTGCAVTGAELADGVWTLATSQGRVRARVVVNCAGNHGDLVEAFSRRAPFTITPRKGQFVVYDKPAARLIDAVILPVPSERTKGVLLTRTAFGNLLVGPTAEDQEDRTRASVDDATLADLTERAAGMVPALARAGVNAAYAGLRPATEHRDYVIEAVPEKRWITAAGIRSTGLTGCLGVAKRVLDLHETHFQRLPGRTDDAIAWPTVPNICEDASRAWQTEAGAEIVCHCEMVTRAEIEAALRGPLPAGTLGGLRRRTRCMLGRCQGFYCSARVAELAGDKITPAMTCGAVA